MKNLLLLITLGIFSLSAFADIGPVGRSTSLNAAGSLQAGSLEQHFIYVVNRSGGVASDGQLVVLDLTEDDGYSVTLSTTAGEVPVCMLNSKRSASCADDELCRCQTYGYTDKLLFDVTNMAATAGDQIFLSENNSGYAQAEIESSIAASDTPVGIFYDSQAASASIEAFLKMR